MVQGRKRVYQLTGREAMYSPGAPSLRNEIERGYWQQIATGITSEKAAEVGVSQAVGGCWFRYRGGMPLFTSNPICRRARATLQDVRLSMGIDDYLVVPKPLIALMTNVTAQSPYVDEDRAQSDLRVLTAQISGCALVDIDARQLQLKFNGRSAVTTIVCERDVVQLRMVDDDPIAYLRRRHKILSTTLCEISVDQTFEKVSFECLSESTEAELDALRFGVIGFMPDSIVTSFNQVESKAAGLSASRVIGTHFFHEVAPCMNNFMVAQRFEDENRLDDIISYVLTLRMRPTPVRLRLMKSDEDIKRFLLVERKVK